MNFLKNLIFKKKDTDQSDNPCPLDPEFLDFEIEGSVYCYDRETKQRDILYKKCSIQFDEDENNVFSYFLYLKNKQKNQNEKEESKEDNEYFLPFSHTMDFKSFESQRKTEKYVFDYFNIEFDLDEKNTIRILIDITLEGDRMNSILFQDYLQKLLYQNKFQESYKLQKDENKIENLIEKTDNFTMKTGSEISSITSVNTQQQSHIKKEKQLEDITDDLQNLNIKDSYQKQSQQQYEKEVKQSEQKEYKGREKDQDKLDRLLTHLVSTSQNKYQIICTGVYYLIDEKNIKQMIEEGVIFALKEQENSQFQYSIEILNQNGQEIYSKPLSQDMNYNVNQEQNYLKWVHFDENMTEILLVEFDSPNFAIQVQFGISQSLFEMQKQMKLEDCIKKPEDQQYQKQLLSTVPQKLNDEKIVEEFQKSSDSQQFFDEQSQQQSTLYQEPKENTENYSFQNTAMDQAKVLDKTVVCNKGILQVYETDQDQQLNRLVDLPLLKDLQGNILDPVKFQLMEQDQKMIIVNKQDDKQIYQLDLAQGKIIRELKVDGFNSIQDICPEQKHSEITPNPVFNCMNTRNLFKMDPRINQAQVAEIKTAEKIYKQNNGFSCMATNKQGNLAVANKEGDIRLYKQLDKNAKCLYPGFGDEIYSLDSTKDGQWVLATCKNYLILLPTFSQSQQSGFQTSLKYEDRHLPIRLMLQTEDLLKYKLKKVQFTPARFNDSENQKEDQIITSTGKYSIIWSISNIVNGNYDYQIKEFQANIKDVQFKYNQDNGVFAALNNQLAFQPTKKKSKKK